MDTQQVEAHISAIDHDLFGIPGLSYCYVIRGEQIALVETGTSHTVEATLAGLDSLKIPPEAISTILCTHIHVDHAGGAAFLAEHLPNARVAIHSSAIPHLIDPSRLLSSARRAIGEKLWPAHGTMQPLNPARIIPADDLCLDLGNGVRIEAIPTPGHSPDHLAFYEQKSGYLCVGDAAGINLHRSSTCFPMTPPPTYDLAAQLATLQTLRNLPISTLLFTHGGPEPAVHTTLANLEEQLQTVAEAVRHMPSESSIETLARQLFPITQTPPELSLVVETWSSMSIAGLARYWRKLAQV